VGNHAIPVALPGPARFAVHKLIIAQERVLNRDIKAIKDLQQANEIVQALLAFGKEAEIRDAIASAGKWGGALANINKSIDAPNGLSDDVRKLIKPWAKKSNRP